MNPPEVASSKRETAREEKKKSDGTDIVATENWNLLRGELI